MLIAKAGISNTIHQLRFVFISSVGRRGDIFPVFRKVLVGRKQSGRRCRRRLGFVVASRFYLWQKNGGSVGKKFSTPLILDYLCATKFCYPRLLVVSMTNAKPTQPLVRGSSIVDGTKLSLSLSRFDLVLQLTQSSLSQFLTP